MVQTARLSAIVGAQPDWGIDLKMKLHIDWAKPVALNASRESLIYKADIEKLPKWGKHPKRFFPRLMDVDKAKGE